MSRVRASLSVSLDGFVAGPGQSEQHPLGVGGEQLHQWVTATRSWRAQHGEEAVGEEGTLDDEVSAASVEGLGATVMGARMFGPRVLGWDGWWGDEPPFHYPVYVVTSTVREPLVRGATTFHFVDCGVAGAVELAQAAAGDLDVRVGGGARTVRTALELGLVDALHLAQVPVLLGSGERVLDGALPYRVTSTQPSPSGVLHVHLEWA
jgi:dihydrofolate reductase